MEQRYHLERKNRASGRVWTVYCIESENSVILKAGSIISDIELKRLPKKIRIMRETAPISKERILLQDITFENLSDAASFVLATNAWGKREWKKG